MKKIRLLLFILLLISFVIIQNNVSFSDFIIDDEIGETERETEKPLYNVDKLSKYIVRNIRLEVMQDIKGAVKISWDLHKDSDDDYIVGRSTVMTDNANKALQSLSIKVVPAGAKTVVIDSNLKPGTYYYCVLARSKIMNKEIELYAGQNYTVNPAVIEYETYRQPEALYPQQVSLIFTRAINKNQVRISWRGIEAPGIIYTVYRGENPLDTPGKIKRAKKIQTIVDGRESYTDFGFEKSGTYYYAVTTRDIYGNEDMNLIPDQSYSITGVYISLALPEPVSKISVRPAEKGIQISWDKTSSDVSEYLIYRHTSAISDSERLSLASYIGSIPSNTTAFIDKNIASGNYYYAVLTKFLDGMVLNDLVKGDNYTVDPFAYNTGKDIELLNINADSHADGIEIKWEMSGSSGSRNYNIFRKESRIKNVADLNNAEKIASVDIFDLNYFDGNISPGKYYYAVVPELDGRSDVKIQAGVNATQKAVIFKAVQKKQAIRRSVKKVPVVPGKEKFEKPIFFNVDIILKKYFLSGKYKYTIKELQNIVRHSDNLYDKTKAKLFIGRSFAELKDYRTALRYFVLRDVNEYFPKEAKFWKEYSLDRIHSINEENLIIKDNNNN